MTAGPNVMAKSPTPASRPTPSGVTVSELASRVGGEVSGRPDLVIVGVDTVFDAKVGELTFIGDERHAHAWAESHASAAIVSRKFAGEVSPDPRAANGRADAAPPANGERALIIVNDADLAMISVLELFSTPDELPPVGVHASACVDPTATIGPGARIGPSVWVGPHATVGAGTSLLAGVAVYPHARIGERCILHANVVVRERCTLGNGVILHGGVQIGTDGFGYRPSPDGRGLVKVPHLGDVVIGDCVEIGANSCVDRGKFGSTTIGAGTKLDNLVQIGHNCRIGRSCVLSGQVGIAGSSVLGDGCMIGGGVGIADHVTIGNRVKVAARSGVMNDIPDGETWGGYPAKEIRRAMQEAIVASKLPEYMKNLKQVLGPEAAKALERGPAPKRPPTGSAATSTGEPSATERSA